MSCVTLSMVLFIVLNGLNGLALVFSIKYSLFTGLSNSEGVENYLSFLDELCLRPVIKEF